MAPELIGAIAGFLFGVIDGLVLHWVAGRIEREGRPGSVGSIRIVRFTAMIVPLLFAVVGYLVGPQLVPVVWSR